jgi:wyosine [tRNA(Phe)-imidazoG37] synthetase (radical SAM superfamily)
MIRKIKEMTAIPVAVLTNGSLLYQQEVREALSAADLVIPSLDAVSDEAFRRVNRPHGRLKIGTILEGLKAFRETFPGRLWLEIMFVKGINDAPEEIMRMRGLIGELRPDKVQLNTVVRPPAEAFAYPLTEDEMEAIRERLGGNAEIIASFERKDQSAYKADVEEALLTLLRRRPVTLSDISEALGVHRNEVVKYLEVLEKDGKIASKIFGEKRYYQSA